MFHRNEETHFARMVSANLASSTQVYFFVANLNFPLKKVDKGVLVECRRKALSFQLNNIYMVAIQLESEAITSFNKKPVRKTAADTLTLQLEIVLNCSDSYKHINNLQNSFNLPI